MFPPQGVHKGSDLAHRGGSLLLPASSKKHQPRYRVHGHIHIYDRNQNREGQLFNIRAINCYNYCIRDKPL